MSKTRVLIVDDSDDVRRLLSEFLKGDPEIEVVGQAPNGSVALSMLTQVTPDLVALDTEMPVMDGLETVSEIRKTHPRLPIIMLSTLTEHGAVSTFDALARGANDFFTKPAKLDSVAAGIESARAQWISKIKSLCPVDAPTNVVAPKIPRPHIAAPWTHSRCDVLCIGASTGGPQALSSVISNLPGDFPVPIAVVQHMPAAFTQQLAKRLDQNSELSVKEAEAGDTLEAGKVLIAPGDFHMEFKRQGDSVQTMLHQKPPKNSCRPAVDVLFRSAAGVYGKRCRALVLTGMGMDGKCGAECIVKNGGSVIAQDESSCVVWGMPRAITEAGLASQNVRLEDIPTQLIRIANAGRNQAMPARQRWARVLTSKEPSPTTQMFNCVTEY